MLVMMDIFDFQFSFLYGHWFFQVSFGGQVSVFITYFLDFGHFIWYVVVFKSMKFRKEISLV